MIRRNRFKTNSMTSSGSEQASHDEFDIDFSAFDEQQKKKVPEKRSDDMFFRLDAEETENPDQETDVRDDDAFEEIEEEHPAPEPDEFEKSMAEEVQAYLQEEKNKKSKKEDFTLKEEENNTPEKEGFDLLDEEQYIDGEEPPQASSEAFVLDETEAETAPNDFGFDEAIVAGEKTTPDEEEEAVVSEEVPEEPEEVPENQGNDRPVHSPGSYRRSRENAARKNREAAGSRRQNDFREEAYQVSAPAAKDTAPKRSTRKVGVKKTLVGTLAGILLGGTILLAAFVVVPAILENKEKVEFYQTHFLEGTTVNGVDISNRTPDEAENYLKSTLEDYHLTVTSREGDTLSLSGDEIGMESNVAVDFDTMLAKQDPQTWKKPENTSFETDLFFTYDEALLKKWFDKTEYFHRTDRIANREASLNYADYTYTYTEQIQGNRIDADKMYEAIHHAVDVLNTELNLEKTDGYVDKLLPVLNAKEVEKIKANTETLNNHLKTRIVYNLGEGITETVDRTLIGQCYSLDSKNDIQFDQAPLSNFIAQMKAKYDTYGATRQITTATGTVRTLVGGTYGWIMDYDSSLAVLTNMVQTDESSDGMDFIYTQKAQSHTAQDFGNTYVEVDLDDQFVYIWRNGVIETGFPCVSGDAHVKDHYTWEGTYYVAVMERNHIMRGERDANGVPEYEIPCQYWMNFIPSVGIGLHDLRRSQYGGQIYLYDGSHGCVNLSIPDAKLLYEEYCYVGLPVLTYGGLKNIDNPWAYITQGATEETEPPTAPPVVTPTVPPTEPATEPPTVPPTEPTEEHDTEAPSEQESESTPDEPSSPEPTTEEEIELSEEELTEAEPTSEEETETISEETEPTEEPTELHLETEEATEPETEEPTEPETEPPTEPVTEPQTEEPPVIEPETEEFVVIEPETEEVG